MSLDLDPTERRIAEALTRIAEAHVPRVTTAAPPSVGERTDRHRGLALAVAAGLIVLLVGALVALAGRDGATTPVDDPTTPPTTPLPSLPADDGRIAVLDDAAGRGTGQIAGAIDRFLRADRPSQAVWQFVASGGGDLPRDAFTLTLDADALEVAECCDEAPVTIDDRIGRRFVDAAEGNVVVVVPDPRVDIVMRSTPGAAEAAIDWLDDHLGELVDDWVRGSRPRPVVGGPDGFDEIPPLMSSELVSYRASTTIMTERYASAVDANDLVASRWPRAATSLIGGAVHVDTEPEALVWQPEPHVVVTVEGADVDMLEPHLRMVERLSAGLTPVTSEIPVPGLSRRFPESELTRVALIETDFGRFVYAEAPSDQGICRVWASKFYGGATCATDQEVTDSVVDPDVQCPSGSGRAGGVHVLALVHGRSDAQVEMTRDGAALQLAVARGVASDGSRYTIAFFEDPTADVNTPGVEAPPVVDTVTVDGVACASFDEG